MVAQFQLHTVPRQDPTRGKLAAVPYGCGAPLHPPHSVHPASWAILMPPKPWPPCSPPDRDPDRPVCTPAVQRPLLRHVMHHDHHGLLTAPTRINLECRIGRTTNGQLRHWFDLARGPTAQFDPPESCELSSAVVHKRQVLDSVKRAPVHQHLVSANHRMLLFTTNRPPLLLPPTTSSCLGSETVRPTRAARMFLAVLSDRIPSPRFGPTLTTTPAP